MPEGGAILLTVGLVDLAHGLERAVFGLDLALHGGHGQLQLLLVLAGDADDFRDELMIAFREIGAFIVFQQILDPIFLVKQLVEFGPFTRGNGGGFLFSQPFPFTQQDGGGRIHD